MKTSGLIAIYTLIMIGILLIGVYSNHQLSEIIDEQNFEIVRLQQQIEDLEDENNTLRENLSVFFYNNSSNNN